MEGRMRSLLVRIALSSCISGPMVAAFRPCTIFTFMHSDGVASFFFL